MASLRQLNVATTPLGSLDGAGDHDHVYRFGWPQAGAAYPVNTRQFTRLVVFRGRLQGRLGEHGRDDCPPGARAA